MRQKKKPFNLALFYQRFGVLTLLVIICLIAAIISPNFIKAANLRNVLRQIVIITVLASGGWNDLHYQGDSGIPMVRFTWVNNMPHAVTPAICRRIWESFFSKLSKKDGVIHYTGENEI